MSDAHFRPGVVMRRRFKQFGDIFVPWLLPYETVFVTMMFAQSCATSVCACVRACVCACARMCVYVCAHMYVCACVRALAPITVDSSDDDATVFYPETVDNSDDDAMVWYDSDSD